jgi:hypothetical protein
MVRPALLFTVTVSRDSTASSPDKAKAKKKGTAVAQELAEITWMPGEPSSPLL